MIFNRGYRQPSVPASNDTGTTDRLRRGRGTRRRRSQPPSCEDLEARLLLAHATIAPAAVKHAALVAGLAPAASRKPALDPTVETLFLEGVERQVVGITPSPGLVAPYVEMLQNGVPRVRVLERLLKAPAARDETVTDAYEQLLNRDPTAAEGQAMATKLDRGGDLRTLLVALASSSEYYVGAGGGAAAGFRNALRADLLGQTTSMLKPTGKPGRLGQQARSELARGLIFSKGFNDHFLKDEATQIAGPSGPSRQLMARARNALQYRGGMTRALAILLSSDPARAYFAASERQAELPPSQPPVVPSPIGGSQPQELIIPTDFRGELSFNPVSYEDTFSGQPAPTIALPEGLITPDADLVNNPAGDQVTYEIWFKAQSSGALLQAQVSGNNQTFNVPILAVNANGKLTGGLFDDNANDQLTPGMAGSIQTSSTATSTPSIAVPATLPTPMTSPLTLNYVVNSASDDNPYTYTVVGPNNAMTSTATVLDQNWHHAALVVNKNSEQLYLDGLLVGAAQASNHYSLGFTDAQNNEYAPTGAAFLGGTVDPLPISASAQPPGLGYPSGFVGALTELRIWSVPRSMTQIQQAMDEPLPVNPTPAGLVGYYDFAQNSLANEVQGSPFGPATSDADATGSYLSATDVVAEPSTIPADPFVGVTRLEGFRNFAPYLAIPFSSSNPQVDLESGTNQPEYKVTLAVGDTVVVEVPGAQTFDGTYQVDFYGFTDNPASGPQTHPLLATFPGLGPVSGEKDIHDLVCSSMAAALIAPMTGTYLIRISDQAQTNIDDSDVQMQISVLPGTSNSLLTLMQTQTVQGTFGDTLATYSDPSAPPEATIAQLLPGYPDATRAYTALVQAAKDYMANNSTTYGGESFTDFLNINTGVTITPQHLFGLQDLAYQYVEQNLPKYLGTGFRDPFVLAALDAVKGLLDRVDAERQNVYTFVVAQDQWMTANDLDLLGTATTVTSIAGIIEANQTKEVPPPYLTPPPPQTATDIGAQVGIEVGASILEAVVSIGLALVLPMTAPASITAIASGLASIGATAGATYGSDALGNSAAQYPTLVVPPDKDDEGTLDNAAQILQGQLYTGLGNLTNLEGETAFINPLFSNVGLLNALANLSPVVFSTGSSNHTLTNTNPTSAAVTSAAWQALLPIYFKWVPVDPTTESPTHNFDNFYPGATPTSAGDAANQLETQQLATGTSSYQYTGFNDAGQVTTNFGNSMPPPTSQGVFPADSTSGGETDHPERLFTLLEANLAETADWDPGVASNYTPQFSYSRDGLYVSGWKLVDANGEEINEATADLVFPGMSDPAQTVTDGPEFVAFGGGWYLNVGLNLKSSSTPPVSPATQATWIDVYANWFHQSSLIPSSPVSGNLQYGGYPVFESGNIENPSYSVSFYPNSPVPPTFPFDNIGDRGFEPLPAGTSSTSPQWSFSGTSGIAANKTSYTGGNPPAPEGSYVAILQEIGSFSQSVPDWTAGSYQITFKAAQRMGSGTFQPAQQDFQVLVDGSVVGTFTPSGTSYQSYTTSVFNVLTGDHTIAFQGLDTATGDNTALIDEVVLVQVAGQPPIADQSFDQVSVGAGRYQYDPTGSPWTFSGQSGLTSNNSGFTVDNPSAPEGFQVAFLEEKGSFSQSVAGWAAGAYQITFRAAQRVPAPNDVQPKQQDFEVLVDGVVVGVFSPDSSSYQGYSTVVFTIADPGSHTITFQGLDSAGGDNTAFIDQVVASPVAAGPPLVPDHGFEQDSLPYGEYTYTPSNTPWTFSPQSGSNGAGISYNDSGFTYLDDNAPQGVQVAFLEETGWFGQSVANWAAGTYQIDFSAAQRGRSGSYQPAQQDFEVLIDGLAVGIFTPSGTSYRTYTTAPFTVTAGSHTITFQGLDSAGGDNTAFIDQVLVFQAASPPSVSDHDFEQDSLVYGAYQYDPTGSPWTFTAENGDTGSGITANNSGFTLGDPVAPEGTQVAFLQGPVTISQDVTAWAGGSYQVSFKAVQRSDIYVPLQQQDFQVLVDGSVVGTFKPSSTSYQDYITAPFTVSPGDHTITFQGLDSVGGDNTALIDQVVVSPAVADPPTIVDHGFEQVYAGPVNGYSSFVPDPTDPPWSFSGTAGIAANGSGYTNYSPPAPQGTQVAYLEETGSFSQSVTGWAPWIYQLSFSAAQRGGPNQASRQDFEVLVDGSVVGTFTPSGTSYQTYTTAPFNIDPTVAGPWLHTIEFLGKDTAKGDNTALIDAVTLTRLAAVADQGFEQVSVGADQVQSDPNGSPWNFSGTAGIVANGSSFITGNPSAPQGTQVAYLTNSGSISQDVPGWIPGTYVLNLTVAQLNSLQSNEAFQVLIDGVLVDTVTPNSTSYRTETTTSFTISTPGSHTITFQGLGSAGGDNTALIDRVVVAHVSGQVPVVTRSLAQVSVRPGIAIRHDRLCFSRVLVRGNSAGACGAGLYNRSTVTECRRGNAQISKANVLGDYVRTAAPVSILPRDSCLSSLLRASARHTDAVLGVAPGIDGIRSGLVPLYPTLIQTD